MKKKLYRNTDEKMIAGVLAGLAEYYEHDVVFYRLAFLVLLVATAVFPCLVLYLGAWIIIPERPIIESVSKDDYTVYT